MTRKEREKYDRTIEKDETKTKQKGVDEIKK
jgi:hypothetical protein